MRGLYERSKFARYAIMRLKQGYILWPRNDNYITKLPPVAREVFLWLIMAAGFKDTRKVKCGIAFTSYDEIRDGLAWNVGARIMRYKKHQIESAIKALKRVGAITTAKTTRGFYVTIVDYKSWQNPKRYENHSGDRTI